MMCTALGLAFEFQSSAFSRAPSGIAYVLPLSISQKTIAPSLESPTCLNRSSLDSILSSPFGDGRVRLRFVPLRSNHPHIILKVVFPDEIPIFADVAVQGRMIGLVHRDFEAA